MLRKCYKAEVLKNRRTAAGKLAAGMPLAAVLIAAVLTGEYVVIDCYNWWYMVLLPAFIALLSGVVSGKEKRQKNRNILNLPVDMKRIWDGQILYGIRMLFISLFLLLAAALLTENFFRELFHMEFPAEVGAGSQLAAAVVLFVTSLWQIPFCLLLQQLFGGALAPLIHVAGYGCIAVTVSLKPYYMLIPGAIPARLMCSILKILPNGLVAQPGSVTYLPELVTYQGFPAGIASSLLWFLLLWGIGRRVFERKVEE